MKLQVSIDSKLFPLDFYGKSQIFPVWKSWGIVCGKKVLCSDWIVSWSQLEQNNWFIHYIMIYIQYMQGRHSILFSNKIFTLDNSDKAHV